MSDPRPPARRLPLDHAVAPAPDDDLLMELARIVSEQVPGVAETVPAAQPAAPVAAAAAPAPVAAMPAPAVRPAPPRREPPPPSALDDDDAFERALSAEIGEAVDRLHRARGEAKPPVAAVSPPPAAEPPAEAFPPDPAAPAAAPPPAPTASWPSPLPPAAPAASPAAAGTAAPADAPRGPLGPRRPLVGPVRVAPPPPKPLVGPAPTRRPDAAAARPAEAAAAAAPVTTPAAPAAPAAAGPAPRPFRSNPVARAPEGAPEAAAGAAAPDAPEAAAPPRVLVRTPPPAETPAPRWANELSAPTAEPAKAAARAATHDPLDFDWEPSAPVRKPASAGPVPTSTDPLPFDLAAFEDELAASLQPSGHDAPATTPPSLDVEAFEAELLSGLSAAPAPRAPAAPARPEPAEPTEPFDLPEPIGVSGRSATDGEAPAYGAEGEDEEDYDVLPPHSEAEIQAVRAHAHRRGGRRGLFALLATLVVFGGAGAVASYFLVGSDAPSEPPLIAADGSPVKVSPPGSDEGEATDPSKAFYDRVGEMNDPARQTLGHESIVIPPAENDNGSYGAALPGVADAVDPGAPADTQPGDVTPAAPKKVRTVVVRPDGTIVAAPEMAAPVVAAAPAAPAAAQPPAAPSPVAAAAPAGPAVVAPGDLGPDDADYSKNAAAPGATMPKRKPLVIGGYEAKPASPAPVAALPAPVAEAPAEVAAAVEEPATDPAAGATPLFSSAPSVNAGTAAPMPAEPAEPAEAAAAPAPTNVPTPAPRAAPAPAVATAEDGTRTVTTSPVRVTSLPQARQAAPAAPAAQAAAPAPAAAPSAAAVATETGRTSRILPTATPAAPQPLAPAAPAASPEPEAAPAAAAPTAVAALPAGGYSVQVASQKTEADAMKTYAALQRRFPSVLGGRAPVVQRADLGQKGIYYRIRVPAGSADEASRLCGQLKAAGGDCFVGRN